MMYVQREPENKIHQNAFYDSTTPWESQRGAPIP
jgi:hypothetical protein